MVILGRAVSSGHIDAVSNKLSKGNWESEVTVYIQNSSGKEIAGIDVTGAFSQNGTVLQLPSPPVCQTETNGASCTFKSGQFPNKSGKGKSFTVTGVTGPHDYVATDNHNDDGDDSDGTTIQLSK